MKKKILCLILLLVFLLSACGPVITDDTPENKVCNNSESFCIYKVVDGEFNNVCYIKYGVESIAMSCLPIETLR